MSPLSSADVASVVGIGRATLERWLKEKRIPRPKTIRVGKKGFRLWTRSDIQSVGKYKAANYNKKPRRKKLGRTKAESSNS
jgi:predicted DNA-binding transcriptional regulator AlpA